MEKHKYTPVKLSDSEMRTLKCFINNGNEIMFWEENLTKSLVNDMRRLCRLKLVLKKRYALYGVSYSLSGEGFDYLNRPRINIKTRTNPVGGRKDFYTIIKGAITEPGYRSGYRKLTETEYTKVISFKS